MRPTDSKICELSDAIRVLSQEYGPPVLFPFILSNNSGVHASMGITIHLLQRLLIPYISHHQAGIQRGILVSCFFPDTFDQTDRIFPPHIIERRLIQARLRYLYHMQAKPLHNCIKVSWYIQSLAIFSYRHGNLMPARKKGSLPCIFLRCISGDMQLWRGIHLN